jgi:formylglycine-generating enzyme required for sulfatase activity
VAADARPSRLTLSSSARLRIPGGSFTMGSGDDELKQALAVCVLGVPGNAECDAALFVDERPDHEVQLRPYFLDRTEVSLRSYRRCVARGACAPSAVSDRDDRIGHAEQPVVQITWAEAQHYCELAGGSLPTEAQWENAARGGTHRVFPWGNAFHSRLANHAGLVADDSALDGYRYAAPVDAYPDGRSVYGALNMAGNVWELVLDRYSGPYDPAATRVEPRGASTGAERVMRGGSWNSLPLTLRSSFRAHLHDDERRPDVGFRCAYAGPEPQPVPQPTEGQPAPETP